MKPPPVHRDGLTMAKLCATPGLCLFCEEPVPVRRTKPHLICGRPSCRAAYNAAWRRDWRLARRA